MHRGDVNKWKAPKSFEGWNWRIEEEGRKGWGGEKEGHVWEQTTRWTVTKGHRRCEGIEKEVDQLRERQALIGSGFN